MCDNCQIWHFIKCQVTIITAFLLSFFLRTNIKLERSKIYNKFIDIRWISKEEYTYLIVNFQWCHNLSIVTVPGNIKNRIKQLILIKNIF